MGIELKKIAKKLPKSPGIYIFQDKKGAKLYIGKASNLYSRIFSYSRNTDPRIQKMLKEAYTLKYTVTQSDIEALILESRFIKRYEPKFNIAMRDDKQYFFVGFVYEDFPKIFITHQILEIKNVKSKKSKVKYIGPFTDGIALRTTLKLLRKIFPFCTCKQKHNVRCLNAHIGKCLGICCLKHPLLSVSDSQFTTYMRKCRKNVATIYAMLSGKQKLLINQLRREMKTYGKHHKFEKAIETRNKIEKVQHVFDNARIIQTIKDGQHDTDIRFNKNILNQLEPKLQLSSVLCRIEGYDISNIQGEHAVGAMVVFIRSASSKQDFRPNKGEYRKFRIKNAGKSNDIAMLKEILTRRFKHTEWQYPDLIIIDGGKGQLNAAHSVINSLVITNKKNINNIKNLAVISIAKDKKHKASQVYIKRRAGNEKWKIENLKLKDLSKQIRDLVINVDAEAHRFAITYYRTKHRKMMRKQ